MDNCCRCVCVWDTLPAACLGSCLWLGKGKRSAALDLCSISVLVELVADLLNLKFDSLSAASQNDSWDESRLYFHSISVSLLIDFKAKIKLRSDSKWFFAPAHTKINKCWTFHRESEDELGNILGPKLPLFFCDCLTSCFAAGDLPWTSFDLLICHSEASCTVCIWSLCCVSWGWDGQQGLICLLLN